jgi:hypothetical protein
MATAAPKSTALDSEANMVHRSVIAIAIGVPAGAIFFAAIVGLAAEISGTAVAIPVLMGACVGVLAGSFAGMWTGVAVSIKEIEAVQHEAVHRHDGSIADAS